MYWWNSLVKTLRSTTSICGLSITKFSSSNSTKTTKIMNNRVGEFCTDIYQGPTSIRITRVSGVSRFYSTVNWTPRVWPYEPYRVNSRSTLGWDRFSRDPKWRRTATAKKSMNKKMIFYKIQPKKGTASVKLFLPIFRYQQISCSWIY